MAETWTALGFDPAAGEAAAAALENRELSAAAIGPGRRER
jgi:hypothetical protein